MFRVLNLSPVNWVILAFYVYNLIRLTFNFRRFYEKFALGTMALTNVLLLGLSDTLAQSLRSIAEYKTETESWPESDTTQASLFKYVLDHGRQRQIWLDEEGDDLVELGLAASSTAGQDAEESGNKFFQWTDFNFRRLVLFSAWGFFTSFFQSPWYKFLRSAYSQDAKLVVVVQRVLADQLFYSPLMLCLFLFYLAVIIERKHWTILKESQFWAVYVSTLSINLCVWPIAQFINFLIIPSALQIPFSSSLSVLWNTYLSLNTR